MHKKFLGLLKAYSSAVNARRRVWNPPLDEALKIILVLGSVGRPQSTWACHEVQEPEKVGSVPRIRGEIRRV